MTTRLNGDLVQVPPNVGGFQFGWESQGGFRYLSILEEVNQSASVDVPSSGRGHLVVLLWHFDGTHEVRRSLLRPLPADGSIWRYDPLTDQFFLFWSPSLCGQWGAEAWSTSNPVAFTVPVRSDIECPPVQVQARLVVKVLPDDRLDPIPSEVGGTASLTPEQVLNPGMSLVLTVEAGRAIGVAEGDVPGTYWAEVTLFKGGVVDAVHFSPALLVIGTPPPLEPMVSGLDVFYARKQ